MSDVPEPSSPQTKQTTSTLHDTIMSFNPVNSIHQHLCGFHYYAHDRTRQIEAHHFCHHWSKDLHQCVIYDSDQANARLIGIEYIIPEHIFVALDSDEKKYWHSHKYEVESGLLVLQTRDIVPNAVNNMAEQTAMLELHTTYGKTIHTWAPDITGDLPLGPPNLMMSFTFPGLIDETKVRARDERLCVSTEAKRDLRVWYLPKIEKPAEGCDIGERTGESVQFVAREVNVKVV